MTYGGNPFDGPVGGDPFAAGPVGPPSPAAGGPGPGHAESNTLATLSVVFAFVFAPAGAILGHLGLGQIARTGERGRDRALTGITLSYFFITVAVVSLVVWAAIGPDVSTAASPPAATTTSTSSSTPTTTTTTPPPPPPAPTVAPEALPSILLSVEELKTLLNEPGLEPVWTSDGLGLQPERGGVEDASCAGSYFKGTPAAYASHEPLQFTGTDIGNSTTGLLIGQGAAVYPDADAAQQALTAYLDYWRGCIGKTTRTISAIPGRLGLGLTYGAPIELGNGMTRLDTTVTGGTPGGEFTHLITVRSNVLLDNIFVSTNLGDTPVRVTQAMIDRIPR